MSSKTRLQRNVLLGLSAVFALAVLANLTMVGLNRSTQADLAERAQFIQQSAALERLNQEIIRALAELAVRNQDKDVTSLLHANGVTFTVNAPAPAAATAPAPAAAPAKGK